MSIDFGCRFVLHYAQMIQKITVKNFRSIGEVVVDFTFGEGKAPNDWEKMERVPFVEDAGTRCTPISAIFGPNAAGKSNIIRALVTIMRFMSGQNNLPNGRFGYDPNRLLKYGEDVELKLEYTVKGKVCSYAVCYNGKGLKRETFVCMMVIGIVGIVMDKIISVIFERMTPWIQINAKRE